MVAPSEFWQYTSRLCIAEQSEKQNTKTGDALKNLDVVKYSRGSSGRVHGAACIRRRQYFGSTFYARISALHRSNTFLRTFFPRISNIRYKIVITFEIKITTDFFVKNRFFIFVKIYFWSFLHVQYTNINNYRVTRKLYENNKRRWIVVKFFTRVY